MLHNCWSKADLSMKGMKRVAYPGKKPVGFGPIFDKGTETEIRDEDLDTCKIPYNVEVTDICPSSDGMGHYCYGKSCATFNYWLKDYY